MEARYLTVDLVIKADTDLTSLTNFLEGKVFFLWKELKSDQSSIGFETTLCNTSGPEEDILELLNLIGTFPTDIMNLWINSKEKIMDIGYECGSMETPLNSFVSSKIVQRLAQLGCAINIRIYPCANRPNEVETDNSSRECD